MEEMKEAKKAITYTKKERNAYLAGMGGQNLLYAVIGTAFVGFYLQNVIFVPALAVTIIMTIAKVWDAINDPMMGTIVDMTRNKKWGKSRPYLIIMPIFICIGTILCFLNGRYSEDNTALNNAVIIGWAAISYIMWSMLYTAGDIPLWSMPGLMTENEKDRSNLLAFARITAAIGGALGMVSIPLAQAVAGGDATPKELQTGFIIVAIVLSVIGTGLFQLTGAFCKERVLQAEKHYTLKENFQLMWRNKPYRQMLISGMLRSPFTLLLLIAMPMLSYYFANNQSIFSNWAIIAYYGVLAVGIFGGQFIATAIAPAAARKWDKKKVFNVANLAAGVGFALLFVVFMIAPTKLTHPAWLVVLFFVFTAAGAGTGAIQVIQSLMIADCVDYEEYENNVRPDGIFFSGQSFMTKLSSGIATIIMGAVYMIVGYSGSNIENLNIGMSDGLVNFKVDAPEFSWAMFFLCSIPCAIGMLLSIIPMMKYKLTDKEHERILAILVVRRAEQGLILDESAKAAESENADSAKISENDEVVEPKADVVDGPNAEASKNKNMSIVDEGLLVEEAVAPKEKKAPKAKKAKSEKADSENGDGKTE